MDGSANDIAIILGGFGAAAAAIIASWRAKKPEEEKPPAIVAGSLVGGSDLARVGDWLAALRGAVDRAREQLHDDARELRQAVERQTAAIERNTDAHAEGAVSPRQLAALIARLDKLE